MVILPVALIAPEETILPTVLPPVSDPVARKLCTLALPYPVVGTGALPLLNEYNVVKLLLLTFDEVVVEYKPIVLPVAIVSPHLFDRIHTIFAWLEYTC